MTDTKRKETSLFIALKNPLHPYGTPCTVAVCIYFPSSILLLQVLGVIRAPGFNRLPAPGEEVVMSYLPHSEIASQTVMRN